MFRLEMKVIRVVAGEESTCPVGTIVRKYSGEESRMNVKIDFMPTRSSSWRIGDTPWTPKHHWKPYGRITKTKELK